jgi:hypothetical protein
MFISLSNKFKYKSGCKKNKPHCYVRKIISIYRAERHVAPVSTTNRKFQFIG